jgi:hypothetical protein
MEGMLLITMTDSTLQNGTEIRLTMMKKEIEALNGTTSCTHTAENDNVQNSHLATNWSNTHVLTGPLEIIAIKLG